MQKRYLMELRHIRYFLRVAEEGSFTRAAEALGIGQPPLSQQIKALEQEIGARLFRRLPHGAELTEAGRIFHDRVRLLPAQAAEAADLARQAERGERGTLRLGVTGTGALTPLIPRCIRAFRQAYPEVDLRITEGNSSVLAQALLADQVDLAILRPSAADREHLTEETLLEEDLMAALPADHPLATSSAALPLADLAADPFIVTPRDVGTSLHETTLQACTDAGFVPLLGLPAPQIASILSLVSAGLGVSLVPASMARLQMPGIAFRPLADTRHKSALAVAYRRASTAVLVRNFVRTARRTGALVQDG